MSNDSIPLSDLSAGPSIKFEKIGDKVAGRIVRASRQQDRDFDTGAPLSWSDGNPKLITVIVLDINGEEQTLYARGGRYEAESGEGTSMETAILLAGRAAGSASIDVGGELVVAHTGLGKPPRVGAHHSKLYTAAYKPPVQGVAVNDLFAS